MDILSPPKSYIDWRCATHDWQGSPDSSPEEFNKIRRAFYKEFPEAEEEIRRFCGWLNDMRNNGTLPHERIEVRESDRRKHGHVLGLMIYDIEYWRESGRIKSRKIYLSNQGELTVEEPINYRPDAFIEREIGQEG